ncbi:hypothetical protein F1880_000635 [Penicillium rolfsii]|nr:hypothetical protein F1880_000635 [Penicillium rolfsii]
MSSPQSPGKQMISRENHALLGAPHHVWILTTGSDACWDAVEKVYTACLLLLRSALISYEESPLHHNRYQHYTPASKNRFQAPVSPRIFYFRQSNSTGGQIRSWDSGTLLEHRSRKQSPRSFALLHDRRRKRYRRGPLPPPPEPLLAPTRVSGALVLSPTLAGPAMLSLKDGNPARKGSRSHFIRSDSENSTAECKDSGPTIESTTSSVHNNLKAMTVTTKIGRNDQNELIALRPSGS